MVRTGRDFVLVHGGFHGGWCYERVADILRVRGHCVFTPTLTGLGERSHLAHIGVSCRMHIQDVVNVIQWERLNKTILCGHSYGGIVITGVADLIPERVASLVYLDAAIPESGKSTLDLLSAEEQAGLLNLVINQGGQRMLPPFSAAAFNVNSADRAMVDALCTSHPFDTLCERVELTGAYRTIPKKVFVRATNWEGTHPQGSYERVRNDQDWITVEVPCGHDVMLDAPARLAEILLEAM